MKIAWTSSTPVNLCRSDGGILCAKVGIGRVLIERKGSEVERDKQRLGCLLHLLVVSVDTASGRHHETLKVLVVGRVVGAGCAAEDVDRVVMPAHQAVGPEMRDLRFGVADDVVGEST